MIDLLGPSRGQTNRQEKCTLQNSSCDHSRKPNINTSAISSSIACRRQRKIVYIRSGRQAWPMASVAGLHFSGQLRVLEGDPPAEVIRFSYDDYDGSVSEAVDGTRAALGLSGDADPHCRQAPGGALQGTYRRCSGCY